ncbi:MAG: hypothetical protein RLZZ324_488, partial [Candidatus Parcubacteria bacterium]
MAHNATAQLHMSSPIAQAIRQISEEKGIAVESVVETIEAALAAAYRKDFGQPNENHKVTFDMETGGFEVFDVKTVVEDMELPPELTPEERAERAANPPAPKEQVIGEDGLPVEEKKFNPKTEIMVTAARELKGHKKADIGEEIVTKLEVPAAFGRMAAQTAKQVIIQKIREAERDVIFSEFQGRVGDIVNGSVHRFERGDIIVELGRAEAVLPKSERIPHEEYHQGEQVQGYVLEVRKSAKGPSIVLSRTNEGFIRGLFALEVPEIAEG